MSNRGLTQETLASAIGVTASAVSRWLAGSTPHPRRRAELAKYLGVPAETLLNDADCLPEDGPKPKSKRESTEMIMRSLLADFDKLPSDARLRIGRTMITCFFKALEHEYDHSK